MCSSWSAAPRSRAQRSFERHSGSMTSVRILRRSWKVTWKLHRSTSAVSASTGDAFGTPSMPPVHLNEDSSIFSAGLSAVGRASSGGGVFASRCDGSSGESRLGFVNMVSGRRGASGTLGDRTPSLSRPRGSPGGAAPWGLPASDASSGGSRTCGASPGAGPPSPSAAPLPASLEPSASLAASAPSSVGGLVAPASARITGPYGSSEPRSSSSASGLSSPPLQNMWNTSLTRIVTSRRALTCTRRCGPPNERRRERRAPGGAPGPLPPASALLAASRAWLAVASSWPASPSSGVVPSASLASSSLGAVPSATLAPPSSGAAPSARGASPSSGTVSPATLASSWGGVPSATLPHRGAP
mmetsp:Transcript_108874/g.307968  ORF Transcript_108874/g.307968 Transcript_108874/m.307968 type:complete len:357 (+) Transcript_108874:599-1669(+)